MTKNELQLKVLEGLELRRNALEKQMFLAHDNNLGYIEEDSCARLDEIESLIDWVKDL